MKSTLFLTAATLFVTATNAQVTGQTTQDTTNRTTNTATGTTSNTGITTGTVSMTDTSRKLNAYGSYSTRDSIAAKYKLQPMPGALTIEKTFPILGTYQLNGDGAATDNATTTSTTNAATTTDAAMQSTDVTAAVAPSVTITLDSASKGIVWVDGLEQGRMKAYLKKSPATYRILAQKSGTGKAIPEGTMHLDAATNTLHIALGAPYNEADPAGIFATNNSIVTEDNATETKVKSKNTKAKTKVKFITAIKLDAAQQMQDGQMQQGTNTNTTGQGVQQ